jgi:hypothetical protein
MLLERTDMYIVPIAWIYVALMMAVAEATNSNGSVLGAVITFALYGALPVGLMLYIMGSPGRKRAIQAREAAERQQAESLHPDTGRLPAADPVPPVREEP